MVQNVIVVNKFELAEEFNKEVLEIVNGILGREVPDDDNYDVDDIDCLTHLRPWESFDEYDREEVNDALEDLGKKKIKYFLGKSEVILKHTSMFYLTLDRRAYTFLRYFIEQYA